MKLAAHGGESLRVNRMSSNRRGFFQANWAVEESSQSLRGAIIEPADSAWPIHRSVSITPTCTLRIPERSGRSGSCLGG